LQDLRTWLLNAVELVDWYPVTEEDKLAKAALLADDVSAVLSQLEAAVLDVILADTAVSLTHIEIARELRGATGAHACGAAAVATSSSSAMQKCSFAEAAGNCRGNPLQRGAAGGDIAAYLGLCEELEESLREKYCAAAI